MSHDQTTELRSCVTCGKIGGTCRWVDDAELCMRDQLNRLRRIEEAAKCIHHWHDHVFPDGSEGMIVSAPHVRDLWAALDGQSA